VTSASVYLPLHCEICGRTRLQPVQPGHVTRCAECGEPVDVVPSETYGEHDVALFERIDAAFRRAKLSRQDLLATWASTSDVELRTRAPDSVLLRVLDQLPQLHFLLPSLYGAKAAPFDRRALARAIGMLRAMVSTELRQPETH